MDLIDNGIAFEILTRERSSPRRLGALGAPVLGVSNHPDLSPRARARHKVLVFICPGRDEIPLAESK